jgi:hypothetical protein
MYITRSWCFYVCAYVCKYVNIVSGVCACTNLCMYVHYVTGVYMYTNLLTKLMFKERTYVRTYIHTYTQTYTSPKLIFKVHTHHRHTYTPHQNPCSNTIHIHTICSMHHLLFFRSGGIAKDAKTSNPTC